MLGFYFCVVALNVAIEAFSTSFYFFAKRSELLYLKFCTRFSVPYVKSFQIYLTVTPLNILCICCYIFCMCFY